MIVCALFLCTLVITGCDKQDQTKTVLGTWQLTSYTDGTLINDDPNTAPNYYLLMVNDTAWAWQYEQPLNNFQTAYSGTYILENNQIIFENQDTTMGPGKLVIDQLTVDQLILNDALDPNFNHGITGTPWANVSFSKK